MEFFDLFLVLSYLLPIYILPALIVFKEGVDAIDLGFILLHLCFETRLNSSRLEVACGLVLGGGCLVEIYLSAFNDSLVEILLCLLFCDFGF